MIAVTKIQRRFFLPLMLLVFLSSIALTAYSTAIKSFRKDIALSLCSYCDVYSKRPEVKWRVLLACLVYPDVSSDACGASLSQDYAFVLQTQGQYRASEVFFKRSLAISRKLYGAADHESLVRMFSLADLYTSQNQFGKAEAILRESVRLTEATPGEKWIIGANSRLGEVLEAQFRYDESVQYFESALDYSFKYFDPKQCTQETSALIVSYYRAGMFDKADKLCRRYSNAIPELVLNQHDQWSSFVGQEACRFYLQGLYRDYLASESRLRRRDFQGAVNAFSNAIAISPRWYMLYADRGFSEARLGQNEQAILDFTTAIELCESDDQCSKLYHIRSLCRFWSADYVGAASDSTRVIESLANSGIKNSYSLRNMHRVRACSRVWLGDFGGAVRDATASFQSM